MSGHERETEPGIVPMGLLPTMVACTSAPAGPGMATAPTVAASLEPGENDGAGESAELPVSSEEPGRYLLEGEHARGGQARVLVAFDSHVGRRVAWKELLPEWQPPAGGPAVSAGFTRRFLREARITARLEHPNICPVHEIGRRADGHCYYTMRLVRGETLADRLERCGTAEDRLKLLGTFWDVCNAMAYAHGQGVIHRDLKPGNVMVGAFGETVVLDWGLAKERGAPESADGPTDGPAADVGAHGSSGPPARPMSTGGETLDGAAMGTPWYMSPEQARGAVAEIDERSDVWGLGAILYELLTGRPPFTGTSVAEVLGAVLSAPVPPVRESCPEAPPELVGIAMKCLERDPAARYASASELADDIAAYMTGGRVLAHEYTSWELVRRFAGRHKAALGAVVAVFAVVVAALVVVSLAWRQESAARVREELSRSRERRAHLESEYNLARAHVQQAMRLVGERQLHAARIHAFASLLHNPAHPGSLAADAAFTGAEPAADRPRMEALSVIHRTRFRHLHRLERTLRAPGPILSAALSPEGLRLAVSDQEGRLTAWRLDSGAELFRAQVFEGRASAVAWSSRGDRLAVGGAAGVLSWRDAATGRERLRVAAGAGISSLAFSPDGRTLVSGHVDGAVRTWDAVTGERGVELPSHADEVRGLAFPTDGRLVASGSWDKTVHLSDPATGERRLAWRVPGEGVYTLAFSPDGRRLLTGAYDGFLRWWDVNTGAPLSELVHGSEGVIALALSLDGRRLVSGGYDRKMRLWDPVTGELLAVVEGHTDAVHGLAITPDGRRVVSASQDGTVRVWEAAATDGIPRLIHPDGVYGVAWSRDRRRVATAGWDHEVRLFDAGTGAQIRVLAGHTEGVIGVAFSPVGDRLASCGYDRTVRLWDPADGRTLQILQGHGGPVTHVAFSPDGRLLASGSHDGRLRLWDTGSGRLVFESNDHGGFVHGLAFSPDGRLLASAAFDRRVHLFDVVGRRPLRTLEGHADWASDVAFSPDGRLLLSVGKDHVGVLWDTATWRPLRRLTGHRQWVNRGAFSPDGTRIVTGGDDGVAIVWDTATGHPLLRLDPGHAVSGVAFSPDGSAVALGVKGAAWLFPVDPPCTDAPVEEALREAGKEAGLRLSGFELVVTGPDAASR